MALSSVAVDAIVIVVVLGIIVAALFLYVLRRLNQRRDQLKKELQTPELRQDRAFNRIAMARREADILARQGVDVTSARGMIAQAQGAFDTRNFDRAYESAQSAHEALVAARQGTPLAATPASDPPPASAPRAAGGMAAAPVAAAALASPPAAAPAIPKNRAESQFQLHVLDQELAEAKAAHPTAGTTLSAVGLRDQAQASFDRGDYTDAFKLSLRARRQLGGNVGAVPPQIAAGSVAVAATVGGATETDDPVIVADRAAGAHRCPDCGYPTTSDDRFCRGCGRPRDDAVCPVCQAPRSPADTFCGRCGARFE